MKIVFCRHTETEFNAQKIYTGHIDIPINQRGVEQAENLAKNLSSLKFSAVFCSDLLRAIQTAKILAARHRLIPKIDSRLREVCLGAIEGMIKQEAKKLYPEEHFSTKSVNFDFSAIGGESRTMVIRRHQDCFAEIFNKCGPDSMVLVVGHGTALRVFLEFIGMECILEQGNYQVIDFCPASN